MLTYREWPRANTYNGFSQKLALCLAPLMHCYSQFGVELGVRFRCGICCSSTAGYHKDAERLKSNSNHKSMPDLTSTLAFALWSFLHCPCSPATSLHLFAGISFVWLPQKPAQLVDRCISRWISRGQCIFVSGCLHHSGSGQSSYAGLCHSPLGLRTDSIRERFVKTELVKTKGY